MQGLINWSTVAWISVHSGNSEDFSNLNQICGGYYVKPVTTSLSLLFCANPGFVTTTRHMLCLYLTQGYSNDSVQNVNKRFTKTTTLEINAGIPITLIAEHKFQGSGNLTDKYYINHKKSRDQPNAHSRSWSCGLLFLNVLKHHAIFHVWGQDTWILAKFVFRVLLDGEDSVDKNLTSATQ